MLRETTSCCSWWHLIGHCAQNACTIVDTEYAHYALCTVQYDAKRNHSLLLLVTAGMAGGGRDAIIFSSRHHCLICHLCHHCHLCNSHHCHIHQNVAYIHIVKSIQEPSTTCPRFKTVSVALSVFGVAYLSAIVVVTQYQFLVLQRYHWWGRASCNPPAWGVIFAAASDKLFT